MMFVNELHTMELQIPDYFFFVLSCFIYSVCHKHEQ